jgi:hypothetical protein
MMVGQNPQLVPYRIDLAESGKKNDQEQRPWGDDALTHVVGGRDDPRAGLPQHTA